VWLKQLPSKCEVLSSNPSAIKEEEEKEEEKKPGKRQTSTLLELKKTR
jgi:hypothetical protein